jgi:hypothetical protein
MNSNGLCLTLEHSAFLAPAAQEARFEFARRPVAR